MDDKGVTEKLQWEYLVINYAKTELKDCQDHLNKFGKLGWELVAVSGDVCYLKRAIEKK